MPQGSDKPSKKPQIKYYLALLLVIVILVGVGFWASFLNQSSSITFENPQSESSSVTSETSSSPAHSRSSIISITTESSSSTIYILSLQPNDFNNLSYTGCVMKGAGHTYLDLNITITNRLNATVNYINASVIVQASQISNGFHSSGNYTEQVSGRTNTTVLRISLSVPIDNVVSGSVRVQVFTEQQPNLTQSFVLQPSVSLFPSNYQQCTG